MNTTDDGVEPVGENPDIPGRLTEPDRYRLAIADIRDKAQQWATSTDSAAPTRAAGRIILSLLAGYGL
jgi:hypothetical protein